MNWFLERPSARSPEEKETHYQEFLTKNRQDDPYRVSA